MIPWEGLHNVRLLLAQRQNNELSIFRLEQRQTVNWFKCSGVMRALTLGPIRALKYTQDQNTPR